jgi:RecJ-like exonuclease
MGSGQIDTIEKMNCQAIILDHHQSLKEETKENVLQINANLCGINGNYDACGAMLSYLLATFIDTKNTDLAALAITGVMGDKQYIGGIRGLNKKILDATLNNGVLKENVEIKLSGKSLYDALYYSIDPYYPGLSGNEKNIIKLLKKLKLGKDMELEELTIQEKRKIQSYLLFILIKRNCEKNILDTIIRPRYVSDVFGFELERFADLIDSCSKSGNRGIALSLCMGNKDALSEAINLEKNYKQKIIDSLIELEKNGFEEAKGFKYFYGNDSSIGGVVGGIAANYITGKEKPLISIVHKNEEIHVSCRANQYLVDKGLDLGFAMKKAAKKLDGYGGGHKIAAGATINSSKKDEFLKIVDDIIVSQLRG